MQGSPFTNMKPFNFTRKTFFYLFWALLATHQPEAADHRLETAALVANGLYKFNLLYLLLRRLLLLLLLLLLLRFLLLQLPLLLLLRLLHLIRLLIDALCSLKTMPMDLIRLEIQRWSYMYKKIAPSAHLKNLL